MIQDADTNEAVAGASLVVDSMAVVSDETGRIIIELQAGQHSFRLTASGYTGFEGTFTVDSQGNVTQP